MKEEHSKLCSEPGREHHWSKILDSPEDCLELDLLKIMIIYLDG